MTNIPTFSVLIAVYQNDNPAHFKSALRSVINQTYPPSEIVLVVDGEIPNSLCKLINEFRSNHSDIFHIVKLRSNQGLGAALQRGVKECTHEIIARMDADDIAVEDRFEKQIRYLSSHPNVDAVGGFLAEFCDEPQNPNQVREVPTEADDVESFARFRCPVNHPTVMFRRTSVLEAGNYRPLRTAQDYDLWMRMLSQGYTIENIPAVLVRGRAGEDLYERRGGLEYAQIEYSLQYDFLRMGAITRLEFIRNILLRVPIRLVPHKLRAEIYRILLR